MTGYLRKHATVGRAWIAQRLALGDESRITKLAWAATHEKRYAEAMLKRYPDKAVIADLPNVLTHVEMMGSQADFFMDDGRAGAGRTVFPSYLRHYGRRG